MVSEFHLTKSKAFSSIIQTSSDSPLNTLTLDSKYGSVLTVLYLGLGSYILSMKNSLLEHSEFLKSSM